MHFYTKPISSLLILFTLCILLVGVWCSSAQAWLPKNPKVTTIIEKVSKRLKPELEAMGFKVGSPIFIRILKSERNLELWVKKDKKYHLFKNYSICSYSGFPGPKLYEGDWQSPEGFYTVNAGQMNPWSENYLSFNIGYPNQYDQTKNRTGSAIMVHGGCTSMGCFAMSDHRMEEIYTLAHLAMDKGQKDINIHIFPFEMTQHNISKYIESPWFSFWKDLKKGYDIFERTHILPKVSIVNGQYVIEDPARIILSKLKIK